jgi:NADP-dependent 3-hydroxy acid dehydrogenase YdfG
MYFFNIKYIDCFIESFSSLYLFLYSLLTGQTIIVTGAASGIGRASAIEFVKLGAKVIVGIRGQIRAEQIAQELENESRGILDE